ncbi:MAG: Holliday junction resolvase RuvX [Flammeovirgaceae bacterium]|nr:MAG: Holliday junction resolvase RuvX [Flammeovirgaceae bacterium]
MGRILAIDYGVKRTGLAVTDPLKIIATALETVPTSGLLKYLKVYCQNESVDAFVIGMPKTLSNQDSATAPEVRRFIQTLRTEFPGIPIHEADERFTSTLAQRAMIEGGMKKKDRQVKGNVDKISAVLILQAFMDSTR